MKRNIFLISLLCLALVTGCGNKKKDEDKPINTNDPNNSIVLDDQKIDDLSFEVFNISKDKDSNVTTVYFEIINNGNEAKYINNVYFTLYEGENEKISLSKNLNTSLEAGSAAEIRTNVDVDLNKVDSVKYSID